MAKVKVVNTQDNAFVLHQINKEGVVVTEVVPEKLGDKNGEIEIDSAMLGAAYARSDVVKSWFDSGKLQTAMKFEQKAAA